MGVKFNVTHNGECHLCENALSWDATRGASGVSRAAGVGRKAWSPGAVRVVHVCSTCPPPHCNCGCFVAACVGVRGGLCLQVGAGFGWR